MTATKASPSTGLSMAWDQSEIRDAIWTKGWAQVPRVATAKMCRDIARLFDDAALFRSHIRMERYNFGSGEYAYFAKPLPAPVQALRESLYPVLAPLANGMMEALQKDVRYPATLRKFEALCAKHGQTKPTPLLLRYTQDDYNCLHRDLYGDIAFPLQAMLMLSRREHDYEGGEFLLVENRPRKQSRATVLTPSQGDLVIFPVNDRPEHGPRGARRVSMRHGVSTVTRGNRTTLGIIFHNAK